MVSSVVAPNSGQPAGAEIYPLFPEQSPGPFQSTATEQEDLRILRHFGPPSAPDDRQKRPDGRAKQTARSALSAPDNFIADGRVHRFARRHLKRRGWPLVVAGSLIGATIGGAVILHAHSLAEMARSLRAAGSMAPSRSLPAGVRVEVTGTISSPAATPATTRSEIAIPAPVSAADLQQRLMMSGLPERASGRMSVAPVNLTAFPPMLSVNEKDQTGGRWWTPHRRTLRGRKGLPQVGKPWLFRNPFAIRASLMRLSDVASSCWPTPRSSRPACSSVARWQRAMREEHGVWRAATMRLCYGRFRPPARSETAAKLSTGTGEPLSWISSRPGRAGRVCR